MVPHNKRELQAVKDWLPNFFQPLTLCGVFVFAMGALVLIGWLLTINTITAVRENYIPMAPSTALLFMLSGLGILLRRIYFYAYKPLKLELVIASFIFTTALALLIFSSQHIYSTWEYLGLPISGSIANSPIGHMSPFTALGFIVVAVALLTSQYISTKSTFPVIMGMVSVAAFLLLSLIFLLAYLFGSPFYYDGTLIPPAINTIVGFIILYIGLFDSNFHAGKYCENGLGKILKNSTVFIWGFLGACSLIISIAYAYHQGHAKNYYEEMSNQISAVAKLKSSELSRYYRERLVDAEALSSEFFIRQIFDEHASGSKTKTHFKVNGFSQRLADLQRHKDLDAVFLLDARGNIIISTEPGQVQITADISLMLDSDYLAEDKVHFYDLHKHQFNNKIYMALIKPVYSEDNIRLGTVVLRMDPDAYLYPFLQEWPITSNSAETLLVKKLGDEVVFLNDLRFRKDTALTLRYSLNDTFLPAVQAVQGSVGIVEGRDYRNVEVLADVRPIQGTPWFMVTRVDKSEMLSSLRAQLWLTVTLILTAMGAMGMTFLFLWRQARLAYYKEQYETTLRLEIYSQAFAQNSEGIIVCDTQGNIILVNDAFTSITGYSLPDVYGKNPRVLSSGSHDKQFYKVMWNDIQTKGSWQGEITNRRKNGDIYPEWLTVSLLHKNENDGESHYVGVFSDITQHKKDEENIRHLAHYDALTGLPNRVLLSDRMRQLVKFSHRNKYNWAILFLDLDRFKNVNDSLGHRMGDLMLVEVAKRLLMVLREEDTACRLGGDEFILLLPETNANGAAYVAQKVMDSLSEPFVFESNELSITSSIGVAIYPGDGSNGDELLQAADTAMYRAKDSGRNCYQFYTAELFASSLRRLDIDNALRGAVKRQEFELYYQPQIDLFSGKIIGCEALLRWNHPELGRVSPAEFIPIAEDSGQILAIDRWVIENAVQQMACWKKEGIIDFSVAVNVSAVQFHHKTLLSILQTILAKYDLPPDCLEIEITEGLMMQHVETAVTTIALLHELGIKISVDDFGTGYSSLAYLKRFRIDTLKIDKSFVRDIAEDPDDAEIIKMIIGLAHSLGVKTIAEGVETEVQRDMLKEYGCYQLQGFLYSKPLPVNKFEEYVFSATYDNSD